MLWGGYSRSGALVVVGKLGDARRFQRGGPGYGQPVSAAELKQKLSLAP